MHPVMQSLEKKQGSVFHSHFVIQTLPTGLNTLTSQMYWALGFLACAFLKCQQLTHWPCWFDILVSKLRQVAQILFLPFSLALEAHRRRKILVVFFG